MESLAVELVYWHVSYAVRESPATNGSQTVCRTAKGDKLVAALCHSRHLPHSSRIHLPVNTFLAVARLSLLLVPLLLVCSVLWLPCCCTRCTREPTLSNAHWLSQ